MQTNADKVKSQESAKKHPHILMEASPNSRPLESIVLFFQILVSSVFIWVHLWCRLLIACASGERERKS